MGKQDRLTHNPFEALAAFKPSTPDPDEGPAVESQPIQTDGNTKEYLLVETIPPNSETQNVSVRKVGKLEIPEFKRGDELLPDEQLWFDDLIEHINAQIAENYRLDPKQVRKFKVDSETGDSIRYYKLRDCVGNSRFNDVEYEVNRWLRRSSEENDHRIGELRDLILRRGYKAHAASWLEAATPERMKFGNKDFTKDDRIAKAQRFAEKAGIPLREIADEYGLSAMLDVSN